MPHGSVEKHLQERCAEPQIRSASLGMTKERAVFERGWFQEGESAAGEPFSFSLAFGRVNTAGSNHFP
jgi:hypothetical protein